MNSLLNEYLVSTDSIPHRRARRTADESALPKRRLLTTRRATRERRG